jgi:glycolate oxidase iron-sulfur subunit
MQTSFSLAQLADADVAQSETILRTCVHCGFCTATCPTYVLLGDELDSPRGRIYLIKDMLEHGDRPVADAHVRHIDRCLSCLACMTTCPSGVHYMHLVDHARAWIEDRYARPLADRLVRRLLGWLLPRPRWFRLALVAALPVRWLAGVLPARLGAMLALAPATVPSAALAFGAQVFPAVGARRARVALLAGCAQQVLAPEINAATIRLLTRHGVEVVIARGSGCCGSLNHHLGQHDAARALAQADIAAWTRELDGDGLDAIVVNASGCGTTLKDYGYMFREDSAWATRAARVSALAKDITEYLAALGLQPPTIATGQHVAYHSACSMQHGQHVRQQPKDLLAAAGFAVSDIPEGHLCCGSAGTYNLLQPTLARGLRDRKLAAIARVAPDVVAAGNIGCITQLDAGAAVPIVHTVELLDWATGGPTPPALERGRGASPASANNQRGG